MKSTFPFAIPTSGTFWRYQRALTTVPQEIWNFERFRSLLLLLYAGRCCFCRLHRRNSQPSLSRTRYPWNVSARRFSLSLTHYRSVSKNHSSKTAWQLVFYPSSILCYQKSEEREKKLKVTGRQNLVGMAAMASLYVETWIQIRRRGGEGQLTSATTRAEESLEIWPSFPPTGLWSSDSAAPRGLYRTQAGILYFQTYKLFFLSQICAQLAKEEREERVVTDWRFAAMVVDRACLILFSLFIVISTVCIMLSAPHIIA